LTSNKIESSISETTVYHAPAGNPKPDGMESFTVYLHCQMELLFQSNLDR
jgi:hypothetical protein